MDYQPYTVHTNVLNHINSNNYSTAQIALALRVPAYRLAQNSPNQSVKQLAQHYIRKHLHFYFTPITSEFTLKLLQHNQRTQYRLGLHTKSVNGLPIAHVNTAVNGGLWTHYEGRAELH